MLQSALHRREQAQGSGRLKDSRGSQWAACAAKSKNEPTGTKPLGTKSPEAKSVSGVEQTKADATASPPSPNERRWRTNGYSDQPLVTNGAGAATGYLPTGLLPTGYLPTGYLPTGAGAAATG
jgi:hypothetical protein